MNKSDFIEKVIVHSLENDGGTFDFDHFSVVDYGQGYFVGLSGCEQVFETLSYALVMDYVSEFKLDDFNGKLLGIWKHNSQWYLDVVEWVLWEGLAKRYGEKSYQYSIYDCANKKEILLND